MPPVLEAEDVKEVTLGAFGGIHKARAALAALREGKTQAELAKEYGIRSNQISDW